MKQQKIKPVIQFFRGVDECVLPEIRLTRSKDGKNGRAFFRFEKADALSSNKFKEIQGMFLEIHLIRIVQIKADMIMVH